MKNVIFFFAIVLFAQCSIFKSKGSNSKTEETEDNSVASPIGSVDADFGGRKKEEPLLDQPTREKTWAVLHTKYHDKWRDSIDVDYYMEGEYIRYAKLVFGNTPEMLEQFSTKLGVAVPWQKVSQVVVRDFVSGAMEYTSAVVHGEF
ncbi:MAG: hypothetical protein HYZ42_12035 [Bacteroidetes bacterium]|nr:hypothetical protein [Bacteroidota bacterium]